MAGQQAGWRTHVPLLDEQKKNEDKERCEHLQANFTKKDIYHTQSQAANQIWDRNVVKSDQKKKDQQLT